jgi:hypothetical protein
VGPLAEELSFATRRVLGVQAARTERVIQGAADEAGMTSGELLDALLKDPFKMELLLRAVEAAARSTTERKVDLIAELLRTGALAGDDAVVQDQLLAMEAVQALDVPHFRLLLLLDDPSPAWWPDAPSRRRFRFAWPESKILERDPGLGNGLATIAAKLNGLGLVRDVGPAGDADVLWERTRFGELCVEALKRRGGKDDGTDGGAGVPG